MSQLLLPGPKLWLLPLGPSMRLADQPLPRPPPVHLCLCLHRWSIRLHHRRVPNPRLRPLRRHLPLIAPALALLGITATRRRRRRRRVPAAVAVAAVTVTDIVSESVTVTVTVIAVNQADRSSNLHTAVYVGPFCLRQPNSIHTFKINLIQTRAPRVNVAVHVFPLHLPLRLVG
jgi:hypothetical protein